MEPIQIYPRRVRVFLLLLVALGFIAIGFWLKDLPGAKADLKTLIAVWIGIPFFSLSVVLLFRRLFSDRPMIIIDGKGLTDNASSLAVGFIPWSDFVEAKQIRFQNQDFVGIELRNQERYLSRISALKRWLLRFNKSLAGEIVIIPVVGMAIPAGQLLADINRYAQAARATSPA